MPTGGYLSAAGIEACVQYLVTNYSSICQLIILPHSTHEGRTSRAIKIANGTGEGRRGVLFIGGCHARELINPDMLVSLALKLCQAYTGNTGLTFGGRSYTAQTIQLIINALDIFIFPLVNPDGRAYVQSPVGNAWWRKNRNPNPGLTCPGVDLNRNYNFLWSSGIGTSSNSCSDTYKGIAAESEPEVQNVVHMLNSYTNIRCMIDVHSFSELILYPWGDDENQTTNPSMNFLNPVYNGLRGNGGDTIYKEYIPADDLEWFVDTGSDIREAIADVRGHTYTLQQGFDLYPTTGTGGDYPYSRHFAQPSREKIYSFTLETGTEFQPPYTEASKVIEEGSAGLIQCLVNCLCIVEEATRGMALSSSIDDMRRFRDETLLETLIGRHYVSMLAKNKAELMQLMLAHKELRAEGVDLLSQVSQRVLSAKPRKFDVTLIKAIDSFGEKISEHSSKRLKEAISEVRRDLVHFSDQTTTKALEIVEKTRYQQD